MSHQPELNSDNLGHYHHREEISQSVVNEPVGNTSVKDMFSKAREHAQQITSKNQYPSEEERMKDTELFGNIIGFIGQAGIGKTTLSKRILEQVVEEGLFDADYIFYLQFRELDYTRKERRDAVLSKISASNDVVIIMDGLDEAFIEFSSQSFPTANLLEDVKPEIFIKNILCGNILPNAKKLITSRPRLLLEMPSDLRPNYIVRIMGLDLESQSQICKSICDEDSDTVFNFIQQQAPIASYCYVPANCILVMHSIHTIKVVQSKANPNVTVPNTITGILAIVLCLLVSSPHARDSRSKFPLKEFAALAFESFKNKKLSFEEADLQSAGLTAEELTLFLVATLEKDSLSLFGGDLKKVFYFAHLLIHEFFVALHLIFFTPTKEFKHLVTGKSLGGLQLSKPLVDLTEEKWEMVAKFLFGICNTATLAILKEKFPSLSFNVTDKVKLLREFGLKRMPDRSSPDKGYFQNVLRVCYWAFELYDDNFALSISNRLKEDVNVTGTIIPSDVAPFSYVLRQRKAPIKIGTTRLESIFVGNSLTEFLKVLKQMKQTSSTSSLTVM